MQRSQSRTARQQSINRPRRGPYRRLKFALYHLMRYIVSGLFRLVYGFQVTGRANVPRTGPLIVVANHLHNFDMIALSAAFPRPVLYMAKRELYRNRFFGWVISNFGAFPVNRGTIDRGALRQVGLLLDQGLVVGIMPEGTRSVTRTLTTGNPGVALIAIQQGVPIVPVGLTGTESLPFDAKAKSAQPGQRGPIRVVIGAPFQVPPKRPGERADLAAATDQIMIEIAKLLPPAYRGVYADRVPPAPTA